MIALLALALQGVVAPAPMTSADVAAQVAAAVPPTCVTAPATDTVGGTAGAGVPCVHRQDAASATVVMPATATTLADCTFSGAWPGTFTSAPTTAFASAKTTADPFTCQVGTATTTGFAGKCWKQAQSLTLPSLATNLLGLTLPTAPAAPAGITVMVVGRQ
ncbi:hypothetical protein [Sphingomonas jatrophae]|uniref:Secreted protein n=1 Tax=Sphingomonas jatrophae TaxID=1166337 RepID=A0A1I6K665_9SPHN|nr:hypothetical protein [Sphingomonas jatrophae]SFR86687.1 hypothetical protein SAMN05192580_1367 [Sphingomonas jatrophae]